MFTLVKTIHSLIWLIMVLAIFYILYAGITNHFDIYFFISMSLMVVEGIILIINRGACPLTLLSKNLKSDYCEGDDIFLPRWLAVHNRLVFTSILVVGLVISGYRFFGR